MNKQERLTHFINGMFGEENVRIVIPDCVQNDCYMEGSANAKIVIYRIRNCSKSLLNQTARCLHSKHSVTCTTHFDPDSDSGTIKALIKDGERTANL